MNISERIAIGLSAGCFLVGLPVQAEQPLGRYQFDKTISRQVLENFLARSISVEGVFNGRGDLDDNIRMLKSLGVKYAGRSLCLWGAEKRFPGQSRKGPATGSQGPCRRSRDDPGGLRLRNGESARRANCDARLGLCRFWPAGGEKEFRL